MGSIVQAIGSVVGGGMERKAAKKQAREIRAGGERAVGTLEPFAGAGGTATEAIMGALGQGEPGAQEEAFQNFLASTGYQSQLKAGTEAITGSAATRGLLSSGATLKRQTKFGQDLAQQGFTNFLGQLGDVASRGLTAAGGQAQAITGASRASADATKAGRDAFTSGVGGGFQALLGG